MRQPLSLSLNLIMILCGITLISCSNAIPTVDSLTSATEPPQSVPAKNPKNFAQLNAGSKKEALLAGYKGNVRISQSLGSLQSTTANGHKLQGTVTLQK